MDQKPSNRQPLPEENWVDSIPLEDRRKVPKIIPNVRNLFYNSKDLRKESWREIEIMNIDELLRSEGYNDMYAVWYSREVIEQSLNTNYLPFPTKPVNKQEPSTELDNFKLELVEWLSRLNRQRYLILVTDDIPKGLDKRVICGLVRIENVPKLPNCPQGIEG